MDDTEAVALSASTAYRDLQDKITAALDVLAERSAEAHAEYVRVRGDTEAWGEDTAAAKAEWHRAESDHRLIKELLG
jgi:predicted negative regulator of RcsB-dependent stress response